MSSKFSFSQFDVIGNIIGFRFKDHNKNRSALGGLLTIFFFFVIIVTLSFFSEIYLGRKEVTEFNSIVKFWNSQNISLNQDFQIAISTKFNNSLEIENDIWKIEVFYIYSSITTNEYREIALSTKICDVSRWNNVKSQFTFLKLDKALCIDTLGLELVGDLNTDIFKFIRVSYTLIVDQYDQVEADKYSKIVSDTSPVTTFYFLEGDYELSGGSSTTTYYINSFSSNITWDDTKEIEIYVSQDEVKISQDKIIFSDTQEIENFSLSKSLERIVVRTKNSKNSLSYKIMSFNKQIVTRINFMTLSEMLARIGGIIQNLLTALILFNYFRNYWCYEQDYINKIMEKMGYDHVLSENGTFKMEVNKTQGINKCLDVDGLKSIEKTSERNTIQPQKNRDIENCLELMKKELNPLNLTSNREVLEAISKLVDQKKLKSFKYGFCEYLYFKYIYASFRCCSHSHRRRKNPSYLLYDFAFNFIWKNMEIENNEKLYWQFQTLKYLMMSPSELKLFENLPIVNTDKVLDKVRDIATDTDFKLFPKINAESIATLSQFDQKLTGLFYVQ